MKCKASSRALLRILHANLLRQGLMRLSTMAGLLPHISILQEVVIKIKRETIAADRQTRKTMILDNDAYGS